MQAPSNITARIGRWSVQHRKKAIFGWLAFVLVSMAVGFNVLPQKEIEQNASGPGESGQAAKLVNGAFEDKAGEQVLVQSKQFKVGDAEFKAGVADVVKRLGQTEGVDNVVGPYERGGQVSTDGHSALVTFELPGDTKTSEESVVRSLAAVDAAAQRHPQLRIEEAGDASINKATLDQSNEEMGKSRCSRSRSRCSSWCSRSARWSRRGSPCCSRSRACSRRWACSARSARSRRWTVR